MSKRSDPAAFARAAGADAPDPLNLQPGIAPAPPGAGVPALAPQREGVLAAPDDADSATPYIDANGFDPDQYRWVAIRRRPRRDGWSEARQRQFIETLADTACVHTAAAEAGMTARSAYSLRRAPGGEAFAAAWEAAIHQGAHRLVDIAFERAMNGSDEPVFDKEGRRVGRRMRQNDRLLMFLLRAHLPERYRHANRDGRAADAPLPPAPPPLMQAIERLSPPAPPAPHTLLAPGDLDAAIEIADMSDGELPPWDRPRRDQADEDAPLGDDFEQRLEAAKAEANRVPSDPDDLDTLDDEDEDWDQDEDDDEEDAAGDLAGSAGAKQTDPGCEL
ncbi:MAG: hypothetical protein EOP60_02930 [Sphingomonadales bacterium]|nr:MAG: hypothetical protein EOP60_02930 [Sphingomonadales bacterium]